MSNKSCSLCGELGIIPRLQKKVLTADLCSCVPKPIALPKLHEDKKKKFEYWKSKQAGNGEFELMRNPKLRDLSPDEEVEFLKIQKEIVEISSSNKLLEDRAQLIEKKIKNINSVSLPCEKIPPALEKLPNVVQNWVKNASSSTPENLFIYGPNGTGKTTLGVWALYYAMILSDERAVFLTSDKLLSFRKAANTAGFQSHDADLCRQRWEAVKDALSRNPLLLIDDVGSQKPTDSIKSAYSEIIGIRNECSFATIYTSNHWAKGGLDGKNLVDRIGLRAADRVLGAVSLFLDGPSKRQLKSVEAPIAEEYIEDEILDPERVKNFQTTGIAEGETTSPFFVAHNPVFQLVSDNERKRLTDSEGRDIALLERRYQDIWNKGDNLSIVGYLLCQNDMMILLALLEILHDFHRTGGRGVAFSTTVSMVRKKLGIKSDCKKVTERIVRSLIRLAKTRIEYRGPNKQMFIGGFVETVYHESLTSQSKLSFAINPAFIRFYERLSFFTLNIRIPASLSYQARLLYVFLESQQSDELMFPLLQLAKLYGKEENAVKNRNFREAVRGSIKELRDAGLQQDKAQLSENGMIFTKRFSRKEQSISVPSC